MRTQEKMNLEKEIVEEKKEQKVSLRDVNGLERGKSIFQVYSELTDVEKELFDTLHAKKRNSELEQNAILLTVRRGLLNTLDKNIQLNQNLMEASITDLDVEEEALKMIATYPLLQGHFVNLVNLCLNDLEKAWKAFINKEHDHYAVFPKFARKSVEWSLIRYKDDIYKTKRYASYNEKLLTSYYKLQRTALGKFGVMLSDDDVALQLNISLNKAKQLTEITRQNSLLKG